MSNIETLIKNAVDNAEITDYIVLVRGKCFTLILVEDFIKDITLGGDAVCDTLLNCWKSMGQFDGGSNPDNGDNNDCNCSEDFVKIHFPKGEGIKVITSDDYQYVPDSVYIKPKGTDKYQQIVVDEEGNVRTPDFPDFPDIPEIDYPVVDGESSGSGVPLYKGLFSKKIRIANLKTDNLTITEDIDGNVKINYPESGSSSSYSYFVDETYVPTPTSQPDGSRSRPFLTLTDAVNARIGTGTRLNPNGPKGTITLLSDVTDNVNPTINYTSFRIEGNKKYTYTGSNTYIFDFAPLFDEAKIPGGKLSQPIIFYIIGEGTITRNSGTGHLQIKNDDTYSNASSLDPQTLVYIKAEGSGLNFVENVGNGYVHLTTKEGDLLYNGSVPVYGANIAPSTPMINVVGAGTHYWGLDISGSLVNVVAYSQVALRSSLKGRIYEHTDSKFVVEQASSYIGYQTRDVSGSIAYYKPYSTKNLIEVLDGSTIQLDNLSFEPDAPQFHRSNSIIRITNNSRFSVIKSLAPVLHKGAYNFIEYSGADNYLYFNNTQLVSYYQNFVKGDNLNSIELVFKNSYASAITNIYNQATVSAFNTVGTISTLANKYLITYLPTYSNNAAALPIEGPNVIYRTSDGTLKVTY